MGYRVEVLDAAGRRVRWFDEVELLEVKLAGPDGVVEVRGLLPKGLDVLAPGYGVRVWIADALVAEARVVSVSPLWGDARKLVVDEYVRFHEAVAFEARSAVDSDDARVSHRYTNKDAAAIAKHLVNSASGRLHYGVAHQAYPDGAVREFLKASARLAASNALPVGGIGAGSWAAAARIDAGGIFARDGHSIAGMVVDGVAWPDFRLMLVCAEELTLNAAAIARHPEIAGWTSEEYDASLYKQLAEASKTALQDLIDTGGIAFLELNSHRDAAGHFDGRIDGEGRYVGIAYGGGKCLNAALVEMGAAAICFDPLGRDQVPAWELKDYLSYAGPSVDTLEESGVVLSAFQAQGSVFEALGALSYAAGGFGFAVDATGTLSFRRRAAPDRVVDFDLRRHALVLGASDVRLVNRLRLRGDPESGIVDGEHVRQESIDAYGEAAASLTYFPISRPEDSERLAEGLLDDLAYPSPSGRLEFFEGDPALRVGELLEIRGSKPRRIDPAPAGEWGGAFAGMLVGRVAAVTHRIAGQRFSSTVDFSAPLRSVADPLAHMGRVARKASRRSSHSVSTRRWAWTTGSTWTSARQQEVSMAIKGLAYTKTAWAFGERPVASSKLNTWDDRVEAALELALFLLSQAWGGGSGVVRGATSDGLAVQATPSPGLSVEVQPGYAMIGGYPFRLKVPTETVDVAVPSIHPRIDLVQASLPTWNVLVKTGTEAASPTAPAPDADCIALARLHLRPGMGSIKNADDGTHGYLVDVRSFV